MILSCQNLSKTLVDRPILKQASFQLEEHEKAAIVGVNGAGKTTLLKMIIGQLPADDGLITFAKDKTFGYLAQQSDLSSSRTIYEELLSVKQDLVSMEQQLRDLEESMKHCEGTQLEEIMNRYTRMTHDFEVRGGLLYKSELTGVLKGLSFLDEDFDIAVRTGYHCAPLIHDFIGSVEHGSTVRVSLGRFTSEEDVLAMVKAVKELMEE